MKNERVAICIPSGNMIHADFTMKLIDIILASRNAGIGLAVLNVRNSMIHVGRNTLVKMAKDVGAKKVLFLDSDMMFPEDTLIRLLAHKKSIVCTDAMKRTVPHETVVMHTPGKKIDYTKCKPLEEISGLSTGVLLVDMKAFDDVGLPYFFAGYHPDTDVYVGEDISFGYKAITKGHKLYCDTVLSQEIGHIGQKTFMTGGNYES